MAITVNTNLPSMAALGHLNRTNRNLTSTFDRLSSGLRVTKAADDAAGLAVAENLDVTYRSVQQAIRNTSDGISVIQVAEGSANEVRAIYQRVRELGVQGASETLSSNERQYLNDEAKQLTDEVDRIAKKTEFNGLRLGDGTNTKVDVQVGVEDSGNDRIKIELANFTTTGLQAATGAVATDLSSVAGCRQAVEDADKILDKLNSVQSKFGAVHNRLESALNNLSTFAENSKASESRIRDADFAFETSQMTKYQTMQQAGLAILGQANGLSNYALALLR